jgi:hypothetical protein
VSEKRYIQDFFKPSNPEKYIGNINEIVYRSSYELKAFHWCDSHPDILQWSSETITIKYFDPTTNRTRRYFPDLYIKMREQDGEIKRYIIEIKPKRQTVPPRNSPKKRTKTYINETKTYAKNLAKWQAAEKFCMDNSLIFKIVTEKELNL